MTERLTFAGNAPYPPRRNDWPRLAQAAAALLAQREARYPGLITAGKLDPREAERALRVLRAVVEQWRRVTAGENLPHPLDFADALGAGQAEMLAELAAAATRTRRIAERAAADRSARDQADWTAALHWHQRPPTRDCAFPHIWLAHDHAQWLRERERQPRAA